MMQKKLMSVMLAFVMVLSSSGINVHADDVAHTADPSAAGAVQMGEDPNAVGGDSASAEQTESDQGSANSGSTEIVNSASLNEYAQNIQSLNTADNLVAVVSNDDVAGYAKNADKVVSYGSLHIIQYSTEADADQSADKLNEDEKPASAEESVYRIQNPWIHYDEAQNNGASASEESAQPEAADDVSNGDQAEAGNQTEEGTDADVEASAPADEASASPASTAAPDDQTAVDGRKTVALIDTGDNNADASVNLTNEADGDENGHGTAMDTQIRQAAENNVKILSIKAFDKDGHGSLVNIAAAIRYAIDSKADIINISAAAKSTGNDKDLLQALIDEADEKGIRVVAAAGNYSADAADYLPACLDKVITVGAATEKGKLSAYSNYGECVDVYVKGVDLTSDAAAIVSGCLAVEKERVLKDRNNLSFESITKVNSDKSASQTDTDSSPADQEDGSESDKQQKDAKSEGIEFDEADSDFFKADMLGVSVKKATPNKNVIPDFTGDYYHVEAFLKYKKTVRLYGDLSDRDVYQIEYSKKTKQISSIRKLMVGEDGRGLYVEVDKLGYFAVGTSASNFVTMASVNFTAYDSVIKATATVNVSASGSTANWNCSVVHTSGTFYGSTRKNGGTIHVKLGSSEVFNRTYALNRNETSATLASGSGSMNGSGTVSCTFYADKGSGNYSGDGYVWHGFGSTSAGSVSLSAPAVPGTELSNLDDGNYYFIQNYANNTFGLDVNGSATANNTNIQLYTINYTPAQIFRFKNRGSNWYSIEAVRANKAVEAKGGGTANSTQVSIYDYNGSGAQLWKALAQSNGSITFKGKGSGRVIDVYGGTMTNGQKVQIYDSNGSNAQRWKLKKYVRSIQYNSNAGSGSMSDQDVRDACINGSAVSLKANAFSKTGYTFTGWNTNPDGSGTAYANSASISPASILGTSSADSRLTLYAQWTPNSYTVTYNANGGTGTMSTSRAVYGSQFVTAQNTFTKTGYQFNGWNEKADGTGTAWGLTSPGVYENGNGTKPWEWTYTKSITLYAQWKADTHYLDLNGMLDGAISGNISGFGTADVYINGKQAANDVSDYYAEWPYGTKWEVKDIKTAAGKTYDGLSSGALSGTIGDTNSYCVLKFHTNTYTVTYNANGGTGTMSTSPVVYGSQFVTAQNTFTKTGYQFNGWNEKADGTGTAWGLTSAGVYENGNGTKPWKWTYAKSITLYAQWTPNSYTISFNGNGSTGGSTANEAMTYDAAKALTANGFTRTGYTFTGWNTSANGKGTAYANKASVKNLAASGTVTLYAQWKVNQYDVTCEDWFVDASNAHKVKLGSNTKKYNYGSTANGSDWGADGSTSKYYVHYVYKSSTSAVVGTSGATVYRYFWAWTDLNIYSATGAQDYNTGTVSLSADGGKTWTDNMANELNTIQPWGTTYVIKNLVPKRTYEEYDHCTSNLTYSNGQWSYTPTAAGTVMGLYMRYKTYTLTYNAEGGTSSKASQTAKYASKWGTMATASRTGYTFSGWFDDTTYKTAITADTVCYGNKTAHAKWTNNGYTIHYNGNGNTGGSYTDQAMTYDVAANLNANKFTKAHYHFTGWNTKADGSGTKYTNGQSVKNLASSGTVTLYAQWAIDIHYVDLQAGDISAYGTADVYINGKQVANDVSDYCTKWPYGTKWEIKDIKTKTGITYDSATPGLSGTVGDGDSTINLHFHTNTYQVQFSANGGTGTMANQQFTYGTAQNLTANAFTRAGYTFSGWVCQNKSYTDKQSVSNLTAVDKVVVTMVAQWKANTNTPYKVVHQQEQLNGTYTTVETQNLTGTTDSTVKPAVKAYTGFTLPAVQTVTIKGDGGTIVTYKYTRQKHTITRQYRLQNADGSYGTYTRIDSASYKYGATIPAWSRAADTEYNAASIAAYTVGTSDKTLSADVARHSGHLVINANGGSANQTTSVIYYGGTDSINPMPTRTGYTLTGLYTEDGNVKVVNADGTSANDGTYSADGKWLLTSDVKVTAHWTPVVYSISYGLNGGAVSGNPASYTVETADITLKNPSRTGYTFTGWVEAVKPSFWKSGWIDINTGAITAPSSDYPDSMYSEPILLKAGNTYNVSGFGSYSAGDVRLRYFKTDGAYDGNEVGTKATSADHDRFVRIMYILKTAEDQRSSTVVTNAAKLSSVKITKGSTGNRSYTAGWSVHTGTITYNANGGSIGATILKGLSIASDGTVQLNGSALHMLNKHVSGKSEDAAVVEYDSKYDLSNAQNKTYLSLARTGYHFTSNEWNTKADGTGTAFNSDAEYNGQTLIPDLDTKTNVNRVVYADWKANTYSIKFNANNGTGTMADEGMVYDTAKTLTVNSFKRTGYTFTGWNTKADGTGTKYSDKQSVNNLTAVNGGAVTLYAQWKADTYTITYNLKGGINSSKNPSTYTVDDAVTLSNPAKDGYAFAGWAEGSQIAKGSTGDKTFTANWKPIMKVSFTDGTSPIRGTSAAIVDAVTGNTVDSWTTDGTVHSFNAEPSHAYIIRMISANHYYAVASVTTPAETDTVPMDEVIVTASQVPALPSTGGSGTTMMLVIACIGMIVSIIAHSKAKVS